MHKKVSLLIVLALMLGLLAGCQASGNGLSASLEKEMKQAYRDQYYEGKDVSMEGRTVEIYGVFGDAYALFMQGGLHLNVLTTEVVEGVSFAYPNSNKMRVYYKHHFYSLQEAYDSGLLTLEDLKTLRDAYYNNIENEN